MLVIAAIAGPVVSDQDQRRVDLFQPERLGVGEIEIVLAERLAVVGGDDDQAVRGRAGFGQGSHAPGFSQAFVNGLVGYALNGMLRNNFV